MDRLELLRLVRLFKFWCHVPMITCADYISRFEIPPAGEVPPLHSTAHSIQKARIYIAWKQKP